MASSEQRGDSSLSSNTDGKRMYKKQSQAAVQNLQMSDENKALIQAMLQDLQVDCVSDDLSYNSQERDERYWGKVGDQRLQVEGVTVNLDWESTEKFSEEANQFALKRLTQCGFDKSRCLAALTKCDGDVGAALENLISSCCYIKYNNKDDVDNSETIQLAKQQRDEECLALKSIYDDNFNESIADKLWTVNISMDFLEEKFKTSLRTQDKRDTRKVKKPQSQSKNICRFFLTGKCKFGSKCKMSHAILEDENKIDDEHLKVAEKPVQFVLEVRFPKGSIYPFEQPILVFYTTSEVIPQFVSLNITKALNEEAKEYTESSSPVVFSAISILEDKENILMLSAMKPSEFSQPERTNPQAVSNTLLLREDIPTKALKMAKHANSSKKEMSIQEKEALNKRLKLQFDKQKTFPAYKAMLENRIKLPAWNSKDEIISSLKNHQVLVISGMTGCGKTTQIPQFILDVYLEEGRGSECNIICTQPRRISAMSVAERVADERAEKLGDIIGYKIRLESKQSSSTRLLYCTTGILLRILENDSTLTGISHVIVDEIHERTEESDFLMMVLRDLVVERHDLRIILMSATLNAKLFSEYFCDAPVIHIPGRTFPVHEYYLEDALEKTEFQMDPSSQYARPMKRSKSSKQFEDGFKGAGSSQNLTKIAGEVITARKKPPGNVKDEVLSEIQLGLRYEDYSQRTVSALYIMDHEKTNFDLIVTVLEWIITGKHEHPETGAVLVFLSGLAEIMTLMEQLNNHTMFKDKKRFLILPLHSTLSSDEQSLVFKNPKQGVTKIVLSTNIAETSVTIDDIVYVIDCGKMKETRYDSSKGMESLEETWVSRANARQRRGRAGRVMSGVCFHMFTSHRYNFIMQEHQVPEIKRVPLEKLCLRIKIMTLFFGHDVKGVLNKLLEPPSENAIDDSLKRLHSLGALDTSENLTSLGYHLAALPVDVRIGKLMLLGAIFRCLDPVLTIAAALSYKSPFNTPFEKRDEADKKRKQFSTGCSDHLTLLNAYQKWIDVMKKGTNVGYRYCYDNFLSVKTLQMIASLKCLFAELLADIGFLNAKMTSRQLERLAPRTGDGVLQGTGPQVNSNADNQKLLLGVLCGALYPNVVQVVKPQIKYKASSSGAIPQEPKAAELKFWTKSDGQVFIHPKSVNFDTNTFDSPYLIYHEKVKTSKVYVRDTSMVSVYSLLLFCGDSLNINVEKGALVISIDDGWVRFISSSNQVASLVRTLRIELDKLLSDKIETPSLDLVTCPRGSRIIETICHLIASQ